MNTLELFAGSRSFSKVAEKQGHNVYTTDIQDFEKIDQVCDIFDFDTNKIPYEPDIIWASPPCTSFSVASIGRHWNKDHTPKTEKAKYGVAIVKKTIEIINDLHPKYWFIENPRGKLRKLDFMQDFDRATVCYCKYGDTRMKPTDIWTNFLYHPDLWVGWKPREMCFNGNTNCHHQPAPRGSQAGTQGLKSSYLKSQIPPDLFVDIFNDIKKN